MPFNSFPTDRPHIRDIVQPEPEPAPILLVVGTVARFPGARWDIQEAGSVTSAQGLLPNPDVKAIVVDARLFHANVSGITDFLSWLNTHGISLPVVVLIDEQDLDVAVEASNAGAKLWRRSRVSSLSSFLSELLPSSSDLPEPEPTMRNY